MLRRWRTLIGIAGALLAIMVLTACGSEAQSTTAPPQPMPTAESMSESATAPPQPMPTSVSMSESATAPPQPTQTAESMPESATASPQPTQTAPSTSEPVDAATPTSGAVMEEAPESEDVAPALVGTTPGRPALVEFYADW